MNTIFFNDAKWCRKCPKCNSDVSHTRKHTATYLHKQGRLCKSCAKKKDWDNPLYKKTTLAAIKASHENTNFRSDMSNTLKLKYKNDPHYRISISNAQLLRWKNDPHWRDEVVNAQLIKNAMHRPDIRKRHLDALFASKWIKVKTDVGQLELLEKWNRLGFHFEPNYQVHTDTDLFYVDGYDKEKNVVLEYDSSYHNTPYQQKKDLLRQEKVIKILKPNKFWRYNSTYRRCTNVLGGLPGE